MLLAIGLPVVAILIAGGYLYTLDRTNGTLVSSGEKRSYLLHVQGPTIVPSRRPSSSACTVRGGGHSWPGGTPMPEWMVGPTSRSVDATRQMWAFFREHPRLRNQREEDHNEGAHER